MRIIIQLTFVAAIASGVGAPSFAKTIVLKKQAERKHAPDFQLKDSDGKEVHLSDYAGKVVLLDFWATWCGPCRGSIPWMKELSERYRSQGLAVVGISMDADGWEVVKPFMEKMEITYPILMGNKRVAYLYGDVDALPVAFFLDREQRVAAIHLGSASRKDFEKAIQTLLEASTPPSVTEESKPPATVAER